MTADSVEFHPVEIHEWEECKNRLKERIPSPLFHTFIQPLQSATSGDTDTGASLELLVPDSKLLLHIEKSYLPAIEKLLSETRFRGQVRLRSFAVASPSRETFSRREDPALPSLREERHLHLAPSSAGSASSEELPPLRNSQESPLREDSFAHLLLPSSLRSRIASLLDLRFPEETLVFTGPSGTGKSSLARALHTHWSATSRAGRYLTLETFLTEFSLSLQNKRTIPWRQEIRDLPYLIIDDFQFIKGSASRTQEELRHLVDQFREKGHKLILCSDSPLEQLPLKEDLASRLHLAACVSLSPPSLEGRLLFLQREAASLGLPLEEEPARYLARRISGDMRKLKSALLRLANEFACSSCPGGSRPPRQERMDALCSDLYTPDTTLSPRSILESVAEFFQVTPEGIKGPARDKKYSLARHLVLYLGSELLSLKLAALAEVVGRKDHTSVIHARKKIQSLMERDLFFEQQVQQLITSLRS